MYRGFSLNFKMYAFPVGSYLGLARAVMYLDGLSKKWYVVHALITHGPKLKIKITGHHKGEERYMGV